MLQRGSIRLLDGLQYIIGVSGEESLYLNPMLGCHVCSAAGNCSADQKCYLVGGEEADLLEYLASRHVQLVSRHAALARSDDPYPTGCIK